MGWHTTKLASPNLHGRGRTYIVGSCILDALGEYLVVKCKVSRSEVELSNMSLVAFWYMFCVLVCATSCDGWFLADQASLKTSSLHS